MIAKEVNPHVDAAVIARTLYAGHLRVPRLSDNLEDIERVSAKICNLEGHDLETDEVSTSPKSFYAAVHQACAKRRFCTAFGGDQILGPEDTQPGDHVALLFGCPVPLILRPVDLKRPAALDRPVIHKYTLVGECYFDGVMYGEILQQMETGMWDESIFEFEIE